MIDFANIKNSIGLFKNPKAVFIDPSFLKTLSLREIRSGLAEMIKHSFIADESQWSEIQEIKTLDQVDWGKLIVPSLLVKKRIVEEDPFEKGIRKALNFGHTIGHAVESFKLEGSDPLLHGEAIAIGMVCETYLSSTLLGLEKTSADQIKSYLKSVYGFHPIEETDFRTLIKYMGNDKKNEDGEINFSLIKPVGKSHINQTASEEQILESLRYYNT